MTKTTSLQATKSAARFGAPRGPAVQRVAPAVGAAREDGRATILQAQE